MGNYLFNASNTTTSIVIPSNEDFLQMIKETLNDAQKDNNQQAQNTLLQIVQCLQTYKNNKLLAIPEAPILKPNNPHPLAQLILKQQTLPSLQSITPTHKLPTVYEELKQILAQRKMLSPVEIDAKIAEYKQQNQQGSEWERILQHRRKEIQGSERI